MNLWKRKGENTQGNVGDVGKDTVQRYVSMMETVTGIVEIVAIITSELELTESKMEQYIHLINNKNLSSIFENVSKNQKH